jgi:conjugal transfer/entry exclusion protein
VDLSNIEKHEIISVKLIKLEASKAMLKELLSNYLIQDPGYPSSLINDKIQDIDNQIQVLTNMLEML